MSDRITTGLEMLRRKARRAARRATGESALRALRTSVVSTRQNATQTASLVAHAPMIQTARFVITSGPIKDLAIICGRAGVAGAVVDGALGGMNAMRAMSQGRIDGKQAVIHAGSEAGCGFLTSSSGTAGTLAAYMITGTMGPAALVAGMGASLGARYLYRQVVGETLPAEEQQASAGAAAAKQPATTQKAADAGSETRDDAAADKNAAGTNDDTPGDVMEDIGPRKN